MYAGVRLFEESPGYPDKNSNNEKIESATGTMGREKFSLSPSHRAPRAFLLSFSFSPASLRLKKEVSAEEGGMEGVALT